MFVETGDMTRVETRGTQVFRSQGKRSTCKRLGDMVFLPLPGLVILVCWPLILLGQPTLSRFLH